MFKSQLLDAFRAVAEQSQRLLNLHKHYGDNTPDGAERYALRQTMQRLNKLNEHYVFRCPTCDREHVVDELTMQLLLHYNDTYSCKCGMLASYHGIKNLVAGHALTCGYSRDWHSCSCGALDA